MNIVFGCTMLEVAYRYEIPGEGNIEFTGESVH